jgi:hypothetical protein
MTPTSPSTIKGPAFAKSSAPGQNKLRCFSGTTDGVQDGVTYGGTCTLLTDGTKGPATSAVLDNTDGNPNGSYSGVYILNNTLSGKLLSEVTQLEFAYTGPAGGGAPRFSIPIGNDGTYAFVSAEYCDGTGHVDINDTTCDVQYNGASYSNWAAFAAANPTARIGSALTFIIADVPRYSWTISNVKIG